MISDTENDLQLLDTEIPETLPVLPLIDLVAFPQVTHPLTVGRPRSVRAVDEALSQDRLILLITQKEHSSDEPGPEHLHQIGTVGNIVRMLKLPDGTMRLIVQGLVRVHVESFTQTSPFLQARIRTINEAKIADSDDNHISALIRTVQENVTRAAAMGSEISSEAVVVANNLDHAGRLADLTASEMKFKTEESQLVLEEINPLKRLEYVQKLLASEIDLLSLQQRITAQTRGEIDKNQREYYLRQQLKAIQEELGEGQESSQEIHELSERLEKAGLLGEAKSEADRQLKRLERMNPDATEASMVRNYLEWMAELPWSHTTPDNLNIKKAQAVLDEDHYGLTEIKDRILEYLSVRQLKATAKGPILCFVGPPGVGKTSLGQSIARALGRKFVRISLGGIRDEAEIRGHRRTYVGSMPGRIIQGLKLAGSNNPVFMLDEVDKLGQGVQGDPAAALLEVLDPEQNSSFRDHYLSVPFDLSRVMFIATTNTLHTIQPAFLDRMEVLELAGYTEDEKVQIATKYLIRKRIDETGLMAKHVEFSEGAVRKIIQGYTFEAGVRNLERSIGSICRKVARKIAGGNGQKKSKITERSVSNYLGTPQHVNEKQLKKDEVGVATGLSVTSAGGNILFIEASYFPGKGQLTLTGHLGETMQESAKAALSFAKAHAKTYNISDTFFQKNDLHLHVPAGAIPKDGPSAGVALVAAIISAASGCKVNKSIAVTGEITLRGTVMPVGGIKQKILAAKRVGIPTVILPKANQAEYKDFEDIVKEGLKVEFVSNIGQALKRLLICN